MPEDLRWWLALAPRLKGTEAVTYRQSAPHEDVVLGRTPGLTREDFRRAARVIHTFAEPGRYWSSTNIYLTHSRGRWWTRDAEATDRVLAHFTASPAALGVRRGVWDRVAARPGSRRARRGTRASTRARGC